jgi:hypothetical protein
MVLRLNKSFKNCFWGLMSIPKMSVSGACGQAAENPFQLAAGVVDLASWSVGRALLEQQRVACGRLQERQVTSHERGRVYMLEGGHYWSSNELHVADCKRDKWLAMRGRVYMLVSFLPASSFLLFSFSFTLYVVAVLLF